MRPETAQTPRTGGHVLHWARWYDLSTRLMPFARPVREKLVELAAPAPGEQVLDVGCGTGTVAIELASRVGAGKVRGIDASPEMIEVATAKATKAGADLELQVAVIEALPLADGSLDLVTSSLMLHHLPGDLKRKGLAEVRRVLRPGGRFVAVDFAATSHSPLGHLLSILGHPRGESTVSALTPLLKEAGFSDVEAIPTGHRNFAFLRAS